MKDMEMRIGLKCSVCGNDQFSTVDETIEDLKDAPNNTLIKCSDCCRVVRTIGFSLGIGCLPAIW